MGSRLKLQALLEDILGSRNVYFQPPASVRMGYPAIVYSIKDIDSTFADDITYLRTRCYEITVIDENPDNKYIDDILALPLSSFDSYYTADNLNHYRFTLFY